MKTHAELIKSSYAFTVRQLTDMQKADAETRRRDAWFAQRLRNLCIIKRQALRGIHYVYP